MNIGDRVRTGGKPLPRLLWHKTGTVVEVPRADYCRVRLDNGIVLYAFANWELERLEPPTGWQQPALFGEATA